MTSPRGSAWRAHGADAALAAFVMLSVGMMIVPLPTLLLDLLIASNLALATLLLCSALYVTQSLGLSALPTLLLITTLYRLALNVSSTRLILLQADAGSVIRAFGQFVVRGDYVVGGVVFLMLTIIQYIVIAKGSERIAEVGARFTLDAMPGKQLAIDADLRAGALSVEQARLKRAVLERESHFYGAMDGAMKFVKGDAIAGIVIAGISLLGGTAIGVGMRGMSFVESLRTYGLLTVGDGLVSQIPSLVISTAAGLVVTRVASETANRSLGADLVEQLLGDPRVLWAAAAFLCLLGLVPGLPALPFLVLATLLAATARSRTLARTRTTTADEAGRRSGSAAEIALGPGLAAGWLTPEGRSAMSQVWARHALELSHNLGIELPALHLRADTHLRPLEYAIVLRDLAVHRELLSDAAALGSLLDARLAELLAQHARELLVLEDVKRAIDALAEHSPTLAQSVVPERVSIPKLADVLRRLLDERVSIRPLGRILEAIAAAPSDASVQELTELARRALRQPIVEQALSAGVLHVHRIDPLIEDALRAGCSLVPRADAPALPADMAQDVISAVRTARSSSPPSSVLVTQPDLRRALFELLSSELPDVRVLGYPDLPANVLVEEGAPISL